MAKSECIYFNEIAFRRYPNSPRRSHRSYYSPNASARRRGIQALHQEIWKAHHGPIPDGHHIHHIDGNPLNNAIENLACLPAKQHLECHPVEPKRLAQLRKHMAEIRELSKEWHSSPEGREWHRQHAKEALGNRPLVACTCDHCGREYTTKNPTLSRFCSNRCKSAWRRAQHLDDVERTCIICGKRFKANKYDEQEHCSQKCAAVTIVRKRSSH